MSILLSYIFSLFLDLSLGVTSAFFRITFFFSEDILVANLLGFYLFKNVFIHPSLFVIRNLTIDIFDASPSPSSPLPTSR